MIKILISAAVVSFVLLIFGAALLVSRVKKKSEPKKLTCCRGCGAEIVMPSKLYNRIKAEAYSEFAERLKFIMCPNVKIDYEDVDIILKEMEDSL